MTVELRTRCLSWWRFRQNRYSSRHDGLHPKRFKTWRWESQLTSFFGEVELENCARNAGWMLQAQERENWKERRPFFLADAAR